MLEVAPVVRRVLECLGVGPNGAERVVGFRCLSEERGRLLAARLLHLLEEQGPQRCRGRGLRGLAVTWIDGGLLEQSLRVRERVIAPVGRVLSRV